MKATAARLVDYIGKTSYHDVSKAFQSCIDAATIAIEKEVSKDQRIVKHGLI